MPWTQNLYVYVGNNPVRYTDPTGHRPDDSTGGGWSGPVSGGFSSPGGGYTSPGAAYSSPGTAFSTAVKVVIVGGASVATLEAIGATVGAATSAGTVPASRAEVVAEVAQTGIHISQTVADRMANIGRFIPPSVVKQAIETGATFKDPQGAANTVSFFTTVERDGAEVGVKIVYDLANKMVVHLHFDKVEKVLQGLQKAGELVDF